MRVRLLVERATMRGIEPVGMEIEVAGEEAVRMIEAGQAEPVRRGRRPERATKSGD